MTVLDIVTYPDQFLRQKTEPVKNIDGSLQQFIDNMGVTMYNAPGIGLAAIQVGVNKQMLVYDVAPNDESRRLNVLINPEIISTDGQLLSENEGCLSVPDYQADVKRAAQVLVEGVDRDGNPLRIEAEGLLAIVLQHEIDHLNGTLFIDHISALKRQMYERRIKKMVKKT